MEKSDQHTCKICNKHYSSNSSLWNHTSKFHKLTNNNIEQPTQQHLTTFNNIHFSQFNCRKCNKSYKYQQSRSRHEIKCDKILEIQNINNNNITNNTNNITNNGTINNNTIIINNFNEDNIKYISNDFMKRVLDRLASYDDESLKGGIPHLVENIKFNKSHKENNNFYIM
jgi:hypothetical protein